MRENSLRPMAQRLALVLVTVIAVSFWGAGLARPAAAATDWGKALADSTISRFPDAKTLPWRYPRALFLYGLYQLHLRTGDARYLDYLKIWANPHVDASGNMEFGAEHDPEKTVHDLGVAEGLALGGAILGDLVVLAVGRDQGPPSRRRVRRARG